MEIVLNIHIAYRLEPMRHVTAVFILDFIAARHIPCQGICSHKDLYLDKRFITQDIGTIQRVICSYCIGSSTHPRRRDKRLLHSSFTASVRVHGPWAQSRSHVCIRKIVNED